MAVPIVRVWHGLTREADARCYLQHIEAKGLPAYRAVEGNLGAFALYRVSNGVAEFMVISLWESKAAIQAFVGGEDIDQAIYYPEDRAYLRFPERRVVHYELAAGKVNLPDLG